MAHDVFISHSSKDKVIADAACAALESAQIRCWITPRDIRSGENWAESITNAIKSSPIMVLIFSKNSNQSKQVANELTLAVNSETIVIPFKIDDILPCGAMEYYLMSTHWLDAINPPTKKQLQNLVETVKGFLEHEKVITTTSVRQDKAMEPVKVIVPEPKKKLAMGMIIGVVSVLLIGVALVVFLSGGLGNKGSLADNEGLNGTDKQPIEEIVEDSNSTYNIPTNYIESIDAYVRYFKFFESGYDHPEPEDRIYDVVFAQDETRYISWEIELVHISFDEDKTIFYTYKYYDPSGLIIHYDRSDFIIQAGWTNAWFSWGYGSDVPGTFVTTGVYYVELLVDDIVVAAGSFEIK